MTDKIDKLKIAMGLADDGITPLSEPLTVVEVPPSEFQENKLFQQKLLDLLDIRKPSLPEDFGKFLTLRLGTDVNSNTQGVLMAAWEGIKVASEDSTSTEVTGDGSAADPIKVEVKISGSEGNQLSVETDGMFVPPLPEDLVYEAPKDSKEYVRKDGAWEELVIPEPVLELKELEDVNVEGATNGQILSYDEAESKWVAKDNEGGEFVINDLDNTLAIQDSDFLPISQILEEGISAKYWRITISDNVGGSTSVSDHRCYEVEFRESEFVPASHVGDTIIGENVNRFNPAGRAFDEDTGSYAVRNSMSTPWSLGVEFDVARVIKFVAIYYYTTTAGREGSPGVFTIEVSDDNITWTEMASYNVKEEIVSGGWYTFSVTGTEPQQRKVTVQQLKTVFGGGGERLTYISTDGRVAESSSSDYATKGQILEVTLPLKIRYITSRVGPGTYNIGVAKLSPEFEILDKAELVGVSSGATGDDLDLVEGMLDKVIEFEPGDILYEYLTITDGTPTTPARCPFNLQNAHSPLVGLSFIESFAVEDNTMNIGDVLVNGLPGSTSWSGTCPVITVDISY